MKLVYEGAFTKADVFKGLTLPLLLKRFKGIMEARESQSDWISWVDDDGTVRSTKDFIYDDTTAPAPRGKVRDSGEERYMGFTKEALIEAVADGILKAERTKENVLNVVKRDGHRETALGSEVYHAHLDEDHFAFKKEAKPNLSLDEDNVLEILKGER